MKSFFDTTMKQCMTVAIVLQVCSNLLIGQTYADDPTITISRTDSASDRIILPHESNASGFTFDLNSTTEVAYTSVTIYANIDQCSNLDHIINSISLYHSGLLLNTTPTANAFPVGNRCAYTFGANFLGSGTQSFEVTYNTITTGFSLEGFQVQFSVDGESINAFDTTTSLQVTPSQIMGVATSPLFTARNPGVDTIQLLNYANPQVEYNNGRFTGMSLSITSKSVSDIILSGLTIDQVGGNKFGLEGYNIPHTITLSNSTGILATGDFSASSSIVFDNINLTVSVGQTSELYLTITYTGSVVANNFVFAASYRNIQDMSGHNYPYNVTVQSNQIDILANAALASMIVNNVSSNTINNPSQGVHLGQIRMVSTTPSIIEQFSFVNLHDPFYATKVNTGTLGCSVVSECTTISSGGDGLVTYMTHNGVTIGSGIIMSGVVTVILNQPISMYDTGQFFDVYVHDPDGIDQAIETNKLVRLGLLDTENTLDLGGQPVETIITNTIDASIMPPQFDTIIYNHHRLRKSSLNITMPTSISGTDSLLTIVNQTGVILLEVVVTSSGDTSTLHQITFNHSSSGVVASNFVLGINNIPLINDSQCTQNGGNITCSLTGSYAPGVTIGLGGTTLSLIADISNSTNSGDYLSTSLISGSPTDYSISPVTGVNTNSSLIRSDNAESPLTVTSNNRYTDADIDLTGISWYFTMGEQPIGSGGGPTGSLITNIQYTHSGSDANLYTITWDPFTGSTHVSLYVKYSNDSDYSLINSIPSTDGRVYAYLSQNGLYNIKLVPTDTIGTPLGQEEIIIIDHDIPTPPIITIIGDNPLYLEAGTPYIDSGAIWTDDNGLTGFISTNDAVITTISGTYMLSYHHTGSNGLVSATQYRTVRVQDTNVPILHFYGSNFIVLELGSGYIDSGARYDDGMMGSGFVIGSGIVNTGVLGGYDITYDYTDGVGNAASQIGRYVVVIDTTPPVVSLSGDEIMTIAHGSVFSDPGASWNDLGYGSGLISTAVSGSVDTGSIGTYYLEYSYTDGSANTSDTKIRTVTVTDQTNPSLTLSGGNLSILLHSPYTELGASWSDNIDGGGVLTGSTSGIVNIHQTGAYYLEYSYTDIAGNKSNTETRMVVVTAGNAPTISVNGSTGIILQAWAPYAELGAIYDDVEDGTSNISVISGSVDTGTLGTYTITYHYTDSHQNIALPQARTVTIVAPTCNAGSELILSGNVPNCNLCGPGNYNPTTGGSCIAASNGHFVAFNGATEQQACMPGTYQNQPGQISCISALPGSFVGASGSSSSLFCPINTYTNTGGQTSCTPCALGYTSITGSLVCVDIDAPTITLSGDSIVSLFINSTFVDPGASWVDDVDGSGTITQATSGIVLTGVAGTYLLEYSKVDTNGNTGQAVRTITITTGNAPSLTLSGTSSETIILGNERSDPGAVASDSEDGDISNTIIISGTVTTGLAGTYLITYSITDSHNNTTTRMRTIIVSAPALVITTGTTQSTSVLQGGGGGGSVGSKSSWDITTDNIATTTNPPSINPNSNQSDNRGPTNDDIVSIQIGEDGTIVVVRTSHSGSTIDNTMILAKDLTQEHNITNNTINNPPKEPVKLKPYWVITLDMLSNISLIESGYQPTWDAVPYQSRRIFNFGNTRD